MARKARDYKAEERRRNELAKQRGYRNRAEQRKAIETGLTRALAPKRVRNPVVRKAQKTLTKSRREESADWSERAGRRSVARFDPEDAKDLGLTKREYTDAYWAAWVGGPEKYAKVHRHGGSPALHYWLVNLMGMSETEYDDRYGKLA